MINESIKAVKGFFGRNLITKEWLDDDELSEARQETCNNCENYNPDIDSCKICKCLISVKKLAKVNVNVKNLHYEETHCPEGYWPIRLENGEIGGSDIDIMNFYKKDG